MRCGFRLFQAQWPTTAPFGDVADWAGYGPARTRGKLRICNPPTARYESRLAWLCDRWHPFAIQGRAYGGDVLKLTRPQILHGAELLQYLELRRVIK